MTNDQRRTLDALETAERDAAAARLEVALARRDLEVAQAEAEHWADQAAQAAMTGEAPRRVAIAGRHLARLGEDLEEAHARHLEAATAVAYLEELAEAAQADALEALGPDHRRALEVLAAFWGRR